MKKVIIFLWLAVLLAWTGTSYALDVPALKGRVNDHANLLSSEQVKILEQTLKAHEEERSNQIAVLIIPTLAGEVLEQYSIRVVEAWKLGTEKNDNGVLLLIVKNDRKIRIEVGRGLEGKLTDLASGRIIRNEISPLLGKQKYFEGISKGISAIISTIKGEYKAAATTAEKGNGKKGSDAGILFILGAVIVSALVSAVVGNFFDEPTVGGIVCAICFAVGCWILISQALLALLLAAIIGFFVGMLATVLGRAGISGDFGDISFGGGSSGNANGDGFSGGGGSFGGGGASGDFSGDPSGD